MPLDMFQQSQADAEAFVARHNAPRLPAGFGDAFEAAWNENRMFGQSIAGLNARAAALNDYTEDVTRRTGERFDDLPNDLTPPERLSMINDRVAKLNVANPEFTIAPMTDDELDKRAVAKSRMARSDLQEMSAREKTLGGSFGQFLGGATGTATDPVNLVVAPLAAPEGLGVLGTALAWAGIAGGTQAAIEATGAPFRDTVQPGYSQSAEPAKNILGAAAFGGATGGALKGLGMAWARAKTGTWPRSIRDAGNVVESEANVANSNVLPGLEGDVAHREALSKTIDDVVAGRRVEVPDAVTAPLEPKPGFDVYHGSPHDFDRFDISKIGTGEGAQSYGRGLYFAEHPDVAKSYSKSASYADFIRKVRELYDQHESPDEARALIAESKDFTLGQKRLLAALEKDDWFGFDYPHQAVAAAVKDVHNFDPSPETLRALDNLGSLYKVSIKTDAARMLDWDKPFAQQSPEVRAALQRLKDKYPKLDLGPKKSAAELADEGLLDPSYTADTGQEIYHQLVGAPNAHESLHVAATKALSDVGIHGIKYLDQHSRPGPGAMTSAGMKLEVPPKTHNIVVFDDKHVEITHKNGEPLSLFDQHQARIDMTMDERAGARASKPTGAEIAPQLPLTPTKTEVHEATIADGVQGMARMTGYDMPREEAERVAKMVAGASSDEHARAILSAVADRPQTVSEFPPKPMPKEQGAEPLAAIEPKTVDQMAGSPEHEAALRADIDRARATGDLQIPAGVDEKGDPVFRSVDGAMDEIDAYKAAAEQIKACASPQPEPAEAA